MSKHQPFYVAIFVIVRDDQNRILLHQRAGTGWLPGYWDFPSGHVEDGESFAAAAVRELEEETSLTVKESDLKIAQVSINHTDQLYVNVVFEAAAWQGTPTITEPHKCTGMEFFAIDKLPAKCTLAVRNYQNAGFKPDLSGNLFVDSQVYEQIMRETLKPAN